MAEANADANAVAALTQSLTTAQASSQIYFVHILSQSYMKNLPRTCTFILPHEYEPQIYGCVGLYSFSQDNSIIFGVMGDGTVKEITAGYFNQTMLRLIEENFKKLLSAPSTP